MTTSASRPRVSARSSWSGSGPSSSIAIGTGPKVQRLQQVEQPRERGILDPDPIARPEVRLQDAFEPVEGAADEAQRRRVDAGAAELGLGVRDEGVELGVLLVAGHVGATRGDALERPADFGNEHGVDDAGGEVADAGRQLR